MKDSEKEYYIKLGETVRQLREAKGLTQTELAKKMEIGSAIISEFESKGTKMSAWRINQIMEILGESFPEKKTRLTLKLTSLSNPLTA